MSTESGDRRASRLVAAPGFALLAVVLLSVNLRPGASSPGPVLEELTGGLGMNATLAGVLTALPGLCFAVLGLLAIGFARRIGVTTSIFLGLAAVVLGLLGRVLTDSVPLFLALTTLGLGGMALGNVLAPAWIKRHAVDAGHSVILVTCYGAALNLGGALGSVLSAPIAASSAWGWRASLGVWGALAAVGLLTWLPFVARERRARRGVRAVHPPQVGRLVTSPTALALTLLFGIQSMNAYVQLGWLPQIYRDAGISAGTAGLLVSVMPILGVVGGLVMPTVIARSRHLGIWVVVMGLLAVAGYLGLYLAPTAAPFLWAVLLGLSGFAFPTAIALITARTRDPVVTGRLSGFVQPVGYFLAALGPMLVGVVHEATGDWDAVLLGLMASGVVMSLVGVRAARPVMVDDELSG